MGLNVRAYLSRRRDRAKRAGSVASARACASPTRSDPQNSQDFLMPHRARSAALFDKPTPTADTANCWGHWTISAISPQPSGRQISIRSVLRQRASPSVAINRNTHRIPVPPVGYRPDRPYPLCRNTPILWTLPPPDPFGPLRPTRGPAPPASAIDCRGRAAWCRPERNGSNSAPRQRREHLEVRICKSAAAEQRAH